MKVFHCDGCRHTVSFEDAVCPKCRRTLAYRLDPGRMCALEPAGDGLWRPLGAEADTVRLRLCDNAVRYAVCNWAVPADQPEVLCRSCRLTHMIPPLDIGGSLQAWAKLEAAKRRLVFGLLELDLQIDGLSYRFLTDDAVPPEGGVMTGHLDGVITINIAEADDLERERRRLGLHEPYRTLLGHLRHEVGHFYWDRLIRDGGAGRLEAFRDCFGDERLDYAAALQQHYENGPRPDWQEMHVSAYASVHPWEDWAETWAHYLHMMDALETAAFSGLRIRPARKHDPALGAWDGTRLAERRFETLIREWTALTQVLNNLNRSLGQADGYPFVLARPVIRKLKFLHEHLQRSAPALPESLPGTD